MEIVKQTLIKIKENNNISKIKEILNSINEELDERYSIDYTTTGGNYTFSLLYTYKSNNGGIIDNNFIPKNNINLVTTTIFPLIIFEN